ncbi:hypothetical protein ACFFQF_03610 [Haladaptatus pallidirubidus]|uniref:hypothetical protein n=1 Tax=Haladaptatus pallidirubidus TaxID=1008152 RepID=UPI0035E497B6
MNDEFLRSRILEQQFARDRVALKTANGQAFWTRGEDTCASGRRRCPSARGGQGTKRASTPSGRRTRPHAVAVICCRDL